MIWDYVFLWHEPTKDPPFPRLMFFFIEGFPYSDGLSNSPENCVKWLVFLSVIPVFV